MMTSAPPREVQVWPIDRLVLYVGEAPASAIPCLPREQDAWPRGPDRPLASNILLRSVLLGQ